MKIKGSFARGASPNVGKSIALNLFLFALLLTAPAMAQNEVPRMTPTSGIGFYEYLPPGYNTSTDKYPVVLFLHGIGERGNGTTELSKVEKNGPPKFVKNGSEFPFILISPQLKKNFGDWPPWYVDEVLEYVKTYLRIDLDRVYLTGLSLGGGGVWWYAQDPILIQKLAALAPVCGSRNNKAKACVLASAHLPIWAFHGDADVTVNVNTTIDMITAIKSCIPPPNPLPFMTIYPGAGHSGAWDNAFRTDHMLHNPNVYEWMMMQSKGDVRVNAGADIKLNLPMNSVNIAGTASGGSGSFNLFDWIQVNGPAATLVNRNTPILSLVNLVQGVYTFRLTASDSNGASDQDDVVVTVINANQAPVANAGHDATLTLPTNAIVLNGSGTDVDGSVVNYLWKKVSGPSVNLMGASTASLSLSGLVAGTYTFSFTVTDDRGGTSSDNVIIIVKAASANQAPHVSAGADQIMNLPLNQLNLTGTASDADGSIATYAWLKVSGPPVTIANATTPVLALSNLNQGVYKFRLTVTDDRGATAHADVQVTVSSANHAPIANAGPDILIAAPATSTILHGSGSDPDGAVVSYQWSKVSGPNASLANTTTPTPTAGGLVEGSYIFRITVVDNLGASGTDDMNVVVSSATANVAPIAHAGPDITINLPANTIVLNGAGSDQDGAVVSYDWSLQNGPPAVLSNEHTPALTVSGLTAGTYIFSLTVTDNQGASATDDEMITVQPPDVNQSPIVNAGGDVIVRLPLTSTSVTGIATDPDGTIASYHWTQVSGNPSTLSNTTTPTLMIDNLTEGAYVFRLTVSDNAGATTFDDVMVTANRGNTSPIVNAGPDIILLLPQNSVVIQGAATDPDGSVTGYTWSKVSGPSAILQNEDTPTLTVSGLEEGTYDFQLTATDNDNTTGTDNVKVTVNATNSAPVADAGPDVTIRLPANTFNLTGSGTDSDGTIAAYSWSQESGPSSALLHALTKTVTVLVSGPGIYVFRLTVTDNTGATDFDNVVVTVNPAGADQPPVADAGADQTVTLPLNTINLEGTASDPDGFIASLHWVKASGPAVSLQNDTSPTASLSGMVEGTYVFLFSATDNEGLEANDELTINVLPQHVNQNPIAHAGGNVTLTLPTNSVTIQGSGSDPDGTVTGYSWTQLSGAAANMANASLPTLTLTDLPQGLFKFQLTVTDDDNAIGKDAFFVIVNAEGVNQVPLASAGPDRFIELPTNSLTLQGSGSDADGSISKYEWRKRSGPSASLSVADQPSLPLANLSEGTYLFELTVSDNEGARSSDEASVIVFPEGVNRPPFVYAGSDRYIFLPANTVLITGTVSDIDGTVSTVAWEQVGGPPTPISDPGQIALLLSDLTEGVYTFRLTATDNKGASAFDEVTAVVNSATANRPPVVFAGSDVRIKLPLNHIRLSGSATDPDGTIVGYTWTKDSGPACLLAGINTATMDITSMDAGFYKFSLAAVDDKDAMAIDSVNVIVLPEPTPVAPLVDAGSDMSIELPQDTTTLSGIVSDDGIVTNIQWTEVSGPSQAAIANSNTITPTLTGLEEGQYIIELSATDDEGLSNADRMNLVVTVAPDETLPPTVNAGEDVILYLPVDSLSLRATAVEQNGLITSYKWSQINGPALTLNPDTTQLLKLSGLTKGSYEMQITVRDAEERQAMDQVSITVRGESQGIAASNIFSPNNDGQFDTWTITDWPSGSDCRLSVYSRQGQKVFETSDYSKPWDGFYKGNPVPAGVYFYVIDCGAKKQTGTVSIIR